jgi:hypothetical protein
MTGNRRPGAVDKTISLDDMREEVGLALFGSDWLGGKLSDHQWSLIRGPYGIRVREKMTAAGKRPLEIARCPAQLAAKLDRAIGRAMRADAQNSTVDSWIEDHGLPVDPRNPANRATFSQLLRKWKKSPAVTTAPRRRGPKTGVCERIMAQMQSEIAEGKITRTALDEMLEKDLEPSYGASRDTCRKARKRVLAKG